MACLLLSNKVTKCAFLGCLPHALLCITFFLYLILGTLILQTIEGAAGSNYLENYLENVLRMRQRLEDAMWNATRGIQNDGTNWTSLLDEYTEYVSRPEWKLGNLHVVADGVVWSFSRTLHFCLITISTIGYGDIVPVTSGGRIFVGFYAAFGIPLNVIFLADIGFLMAKLIIGTIHAWKMWRHNRHKMSTFVPAPKRMNPLRPPVLAMRAPSTIRISHSASTHGISSFQPQAFNITQSINTAQSRSVSAYGLKTAGSTTTLFHPLTTVQSRGISACSMMSIHGPKSVVNKDVAMCDSKHGKFRAAQRKRYSYTYGNSTYGGHTALTHHRISPFITGRTYRQSVSSVIPNLETPDHNDVTSDNISDHHMDMEYMNDAHEKNDTLSRADEIIDTMDADEGAVDMEVPLIIVLLILVLYISLGSYLISVVENWNYYEAVYFTFTTLTTIGFGDIVPNNHYQDKFFCISIIYTVIGLAVMSTCIALTQSKVLRGIDTFTMWVKAQSDL